MYVLHIGLVTTAIYYRHQNKTLKEELCAPWRTDFFHIGNTVLNVK